MIAPLAGHLRSGEFDLVKKQSKTLNCSVTRKKDVQKKKKSIPFEESLSTCINLDRKCTLLDVYSSFQQLFFTLHFK